MLTNEEKRMDNLLKQKIRQVTPELPGEGFVPSVMFSIEQLALAKQKKKEEPLISPKGWFIVVMVISVLTTLFVLTSSEAFSLQPLIDQLDRFNENYLSVFFSNFFLLALVVFVLFFLVQIFVISGYLEKARSVEH
ncbi:MAG TPA: hypothetical protein PLU49_06495 [Saprospiraceae bacterium]|nr:hypothetical protein [Saprospiraceae bacterium]